MIEIENTNKEHNLIRTSDSLINYEETADQIIQNENYRDRLDTVDQNDATEIKASDVKNSFQMHETLRDRIVSQFIVNRCNSVQVMTTNALASKSIVK